MTVVVENLDEQFLQEGFPFAILPPFHIQACFGYR
jgi:hypothetical protein